MLRISLLGEQVIIDEATGLVRTRSSRTVALAAYLAAHAGTPQTRQRIASQFWPDSTDAQALTNLRRELHHLRGVLGDDDSLTVTSTDLCWRDSATCRVDVRVFRRERALAVDGVETGGRGASDDVVLRHGQEAIAAYTGPLLPGLYDDWALALREDLERECVDLCDLVSAAARRSGHPDAGVGAARRRIQLQPLEEAGYRTLMELQADLGDRAGAISTYHHCASTLEREFDVEPDAATSRLLDQLLGVSSRLGRRTEPGRGARRSGAAAAGLVGRRSELATLERAFGGATTGDLRVAVVTGDAGVGKTRLVAEAALLAEQQGAIVASALCFGSSVRLALAPVADWLRHPSFQSASSTLDPVWRSEVDRLVPRAGSQASDASSRAMVDAWQRHRFFEGLARALLSVDRPAMLVLENLQWCDQVTLDFLAFLVGNSPEAPLMVAVTGRSDELSRSREYAGWLDRLRASGHLCEIPVQPFGVDDTTRLAELLAPGLHQEQDPGFLKAATGGFPLFIVEATRGASDGPGPTELTPGDLSSVLSNRIEQASPNARNVAGLAAALGRDFRLDLLTEACDLDPAEVVRAVDELWRRRIVDEVQDGYDFSHDLLRDAAYGSVSPPGRWLLHRRLAQALELVHAGHTDAVAPQLADQCARGGQPERAVAHYRRAAEVAVGVFAHLEAIKHHRAALEQIRKLPQGAYRDGLELDVRQAMAAPLTARYGYAAPELQEVLERTVELAERLGRTEDLVAERVGLWASRFVQGRTEEAHDLGALVLSETGESDTTLSGQAHFSFAATALHLGMPQVAAEHFELACARTVDAESLSVGTRPAIHARAWSAHAHWILGQHERAARSAAEAVERARAVQHPYSLTVALAYASISHQLLDDHEALSASVAELRELSDRYRFVYYRDWGVILEGWMRREPTRVQEGIDSLKAIGAHARMPYWLTLLATVSAPVPARAALDAALAAAQLSGDRWWLPEILRLRAAHDDAAFAAIRLRQAVALAREQGSVTLLARCRADLARQGER